MSHLQIDDISKVRTTPNHLIIEPGPENDYIKIDTSEGSIKAWVDGSYDPEKHSVTYGKVMVVPPRLDDELETEMELQVGDEVFFHYLCCMNAIRDKLFMVQKEQIYYKINYGAVFCAKRNGKTIMVNGNILVEPVDDSAEKTDAGLIIPKSKQSKNSCNEGIVLEAGTPLKSEKKACEVGDRIFFRTHAQVPLQYSMFNNFSPEKEVYRLKYCHIYGKVK